MSKQAADYVAKTTPDPKREQVERLKQLFPEAITAGVVALALAVALAQERLVETLRAGVVQVKRWGGRILILVGLWLIVLGIWADIFAQIFLV